MTGKCIHTNKNFKIAVVHYYLNVLLNKTAIVKI